MNLKKYAKLIKILKFLMIALSVIIIMKYIYIVVHGKTQMLIMNIVMHKVIFIR